MDVGRWVALYVATVAGEDADALDLHAPMSVHELDSVDMAMEFEKAFACEADPEQFLRGDRTLAESIETLRDRLAVCGPSLSGHPANPLSRP
ncbi:MAG: hypothetical protein WAP03_07970 [Methylorubrum rhodinum]|uniref:hypothetical protein n=1 Tax=Methylorubrum rhodinum TaxID=29428 RepID=UPI003BAF29ED